jgi:hypothetical protein
VNKINVNSVLSLITAQQPSREQMITGQEPLIEMDEVHDSEQEIESVDLIESNTDSTPSVVQQYTLLDILRNNILLRNSIILWFTW